jgi:membrane fusion protein, multidrug efflux system
MLERPVIGVLLAAVIGCGPTTPSSTPPPKVSQDSPVPVDRSVLEVPGRTECVPGQKGIIAPVPLHPVVEVLIAPGDRVMKGQALVKLDDDEARADVRVKEAALANARSALTEARHSLGVLEKLYQRGVMSDQRYREAQVALAKAETEEQAAKAMLEAALAELEHFLVTAPIDGVVSWLDVNPGMVSRPGTTVWGEILDLSEIDVRCALTTDQADKVCVGQPAAVLPGNDQGRDEEGRVVFVGIAATPGTDLVPVVVRLPNPKGRFRCGVPVRVRFSEHR